MHLIQNSILSAYTYIFYLICLHSFKEVYLHQNNKKKSLSIISTVGIYLSARKKTNQVCALTSSDLKDK